MGKPLISDAQMLAIHSAMLELRRAAPRRSAAAAQEAWPIALLAATLLQLRSDDLLVTAGELSLAATAFRSAQQPSFHPDLVPFTSACSAASAAAVAAGYALAQSHACRPGDHAPITVAMMSVGAPQADALRLAGEHSLPLLLILRDEPGKPRPTIVAPPTVEVIPVDAEDAVAVCRVVQEATLRARNRWGAVILRAISLPGSVDSLLSFERHLQRRGLKPTSTFDESR